MRLFLILIFLSWPAYAKKYYWKVIHVIDGDTLSIENHIVIEELPLKVRLYGIDTPETGWRAKCRREAYLAVKAKEFTDIHIKTAKEIYFTNIKWDKYGGRIVAKTFVDGNDLSQMLISNGLAKPYFGDKKSSWCD